MLQLSQWVEDKMAAMDKEEVNDDNVMTDTADVSPTLLNLLPSLDMSYSHTNSNLNQSFTFI